MQQVEVRRTIAASRAAVWEVYTDYRGWSRWAGIGEVRVARQGAPAVNGVGCLRVITAGGVSVEEEIVVFEPPNHMAYRVVRGGIPIRNHLGEVFFEDIGGRTQVTWRCRFDSRVPGLGFLWWVIVRAVFVKTLTRLAKYPFPSAAEA